MQGLTIRLAQEGDISAIRDLLADDEFGATREDLTPQGLDKYKAAFAAIQADARNELWVAELDGNVVGTWQVTYIPYLSRGGNERCLIEAVRTCSKLRGRGIGTAMMKFAIDQARQRGCLLAQLTSEKTRDDAHRFYENFGFEPSHTGMKIKL